MWYVINSERWEREQESLNAIGVTFTVDEGAKAAGYIRLQVSVTPDSSILEIPGRFLPLELTIVYPGTFPFFRPDVYAPDISLPRHHNPVEKNLCLLPRQTSHWLPETTIGEYLTEQLAKVLRAGEIVAAEILQANDEEQGEPVSEYYPSTANAPVLIDTDGFDSLPASEKEVDYLGSFSAGFPPQANLPSRIWALECFDANQNSLGKLPQNIHHAFPTRTTGEVYRLAERPPNVDAAKDYAWLLELIKQNKVPFIKPKSSLALKKGDTINQIIGVSFPEEHSPGKYSWGWLFIIGFTHHQSKTVNKKIVLVPVKGFYYAKANRINMSELGFRIQSLKPLRNKTVAIFGLGALGGSSAIELAKNGTSVLRLIDFDTVGGGTIVRWPLGVSAAGMYKTDALAKFISENYPYTQVYPLLYRVGASEVGPSATPPAGVSSEAFMDAVLDGASMIYDATAETGASHFLSEEAKKRGIHFVSVYATPGVWGGAAMRVVPASTKGCWMCFQYALKDGLIPSPPVNRDANIQAVGCGDISFVGTSFELDNIVSAGVRLAASTLCSPEDGYQELNGDIGILSLVDELGNHIFPKWSAHHLDTHPACPYCNPQI